MERTIRRVVLAYGTVAIANALLKRIKAYLRRYTNNTTHAHNAALETDTTPLAKLTGAEYLPPLPEPVANALSRSCLCFLATSSDDEPHLSLMRFTYMRSLTNAASELLVMSTRRNTKKFAILMANQHVALLIHDFDSRRLSDEEEAEQAHSGGGARVSITLNGCAREETGALGERYRAAHLAANRKYKQFIEGDGIAVLTIEIISARVCDVNDSVRHFSRVRSPETSPGAPPVWEESDSCSFSERLSRIESK